MPMPVFFHEFNPHVIDTEKTLYLFWFQIMPLITLDI